MLFALVGLPPAQDLLDRAFERLGGRDRLAQIRSVELLTSGHDYLPEQSERPTGPFLVSYRRGTRKLDFDAGTEALALTMAGLVYGDQEFTRKFTIEMGQGRFASPLEARLSHLRLGLGPERVLFTAARSKDLRRGRPEMFNGTRHEVLEFHWGQIPVRVLLRSADATPAAVETRLPMPFPWAPWGDVTTRFRWSAWQLLPGGVWEPSQTVTEIGIYVVSDETATKATVQLGQGVAVTVEPPVIRPEDPAPTLARYRESEIRPGIWQYQGPFNTFVVEQPDGLVVIEPVMSSAFASAFLDRLRVKFPGKAVRWVVPTDDAWPHFGGIRSFVARGARIAALDLNAPLLTRVLASRHGTLPDELAAKPRRASFMRVRRPVTVGSGLNRFVAYPVDGSGSERMMMLYFPEHRLLYGSDLLQKTGNGFFFPAYPKELVTAVQREHLVVDTVFGEHLPPTPWSTVTDFVKNLSASSQGGT